MLLIGIALALISLLSIKRQERTDDGTGIVAIIAPDSASLSEFL
jgi:putative exporter of polyketide antibiotics